MTSFIDEISIKQNSLERKYFHWQQQCEENQSKLKQRVEWCQFIDDKYKVRLFFFEKTKIDFYFYLKKQRLFTKLIHYKMKSINVDELFRKHRSKHKIVPKPFTNSIVSMMFVER